MKNAGPNQSVAFIFLFFVSILAYLRSKKLPVVDHTCSVGEMHLILQQQLTNNRLINMTLNKGTMNPV